MKKILLVLAILIFALQANAAMSFKDAQAENGRTPMAVFVYAKWAQNYNDSLNVFRKLQSTLGNTYNYVELDLASDDAKEYTEIYLVRPRLPYIMLYRSNGNVQRLLERPCASDLNCALQKMKLFYR